MRHLDCDTFLLLAATFCLFVMYDSAVTCCQDSLLTHWRVDAGSTGFAAQCNT